MRPEASEQRRQKGNLIRLGTIAEVDVDAARCRVTTGELTTDWVPWLVPRVGNTIEWSAPSVGEQGLVLCPDGDTSGAVFQRGVYSDAMAAPDKSEHMHLVRFPDGTEVRYDDAAHALTVTLAGNGTVEVTANGSVTVNSEGGVTVNADATINGDVQVNGTLTASEDCIGGGVSLKTHLHAGVESGTSMTGPPQ